jgi:diaminopimelate epimerase
VIFASKYQAYGNDFLIVAADQLSEESRSGLARAICDPHFGLGADGCVFVEIPSAGPFGFRIFNRDGSEAGMSGNGARCAAAYLLHRGLASGRVDLRTAEGERWFELIRGGEPAWLFRSGMGRARFRAYEVPFSGAPPDETVRNVPMMVGDREVSIHALWVGNPQCVVFLETLPDERAFQTLGNGLSKHPLFPEGTNVSFVCVAGPDQLEVRIWERGVGPTLSSGTGCCGAAVAALAEGRVESPVKVRTATGTQTVEWRPEEPIHLTGEARFVADIHFHWP